METFPHPRVGPRQPNPTKKQAMPNPGRPTLAQSNQDHLFLCWPEKLAPRHVRGSDFSPWQPWWEIRVSGSDVYHTLRGGSAIARLGFFGLACVAEQISRSAARIVFATLRGGSDFRDCNENILLFFSSTQAREIRAAARRWRKSSARSLRGEKGEN